MFVSKIELLPRILSFRCDLISKSGVAGEERSVDHGEFNFLLSGQVEEFRDLGFKVIYCILY